jgi:hypothetical protein
MGGRTVADAAGVWEAVVVGTVVPWRAGAAATGVTGESAGDQSSAKRSQTWSKRLINILACAANYKLLS